jgi:hypothetical protein
MSDRRKDASVSWQRVPSFHIVFGEKAFFLSKPLAGGGGDDFPHIRYP